MIGLAKLGTKGDSADFRLGLEKDMKTANRTAKQLTEDIKEYKGSDRKRLAQEFSKEWKRYQTVGEQINTKSNAIVRVMEKREGKAASSMAASPGAMSEGAGSSDSQMLAQEEQERDIEFLEYDVVEIENRHQRILELERGVVEVAEMFKDIQMLVDEQQHGIDIISDNISRAKDNTEEAHKQLQEAEKENNKARRRKCFLLVLALAVLGAVVGITTGVLKSA